MPGQILGSPAYLAPELASGRGRASMATDVYSLGAVLYEVLAGRPPFESPSLLETLRKAAESEPPPLRGAALAVPADLESICFKCLRKDPSHRYDSAGALAAELERFQNGEPVVARRLSRTGRLWRWCRRHPQLAALYTLAVVLTAPWRLAEPLRPSSSTRAGHAR